MNNEIKKAIKGLSTSLEQLGLQKLNAKSFFESINSTFTKLTANNSQPATEENALKITNFLVNKLKLRDAINDAATLKAIVTEIKALVTQIISQAPTVAVETPVRGATVETPMPTTPVVAPKPTTPVVKGRSSMIFRQLHDTPKTKVLQEAHQGTSDEEPSDDEKWAVTPTKKQTPLSKSVQSHSTQLEGEQPKPKTPTKKTHKSRPQAATYCPLPTTIKLPANVDPRLMEKMAHVRKQEALREKELQEQRALAMSAVPPTVDPVVSHVTKADKKQTYLPARTLKTSPAKRKVQLQERKGERKLPPLSQKIDFGDIKKTLRSNAAQTEPAIAQQAVPAQPPSTSPPFTPDTPLSLALQASPIASPHRAQRSPVGRRTPNPVSSPLVLSEFSSNADSTPKQGSAKKQKIATDTPTRQVTENHFAVPSPRTPHATPRLTPNRAAALVNSPARPFTLSPELRSMHTPGSRSSTPEAVVGKRELKPKRATRVYSSSDFSNIGSDSEQATFSPVLTTPISVPIINTRRASQHTPALNVTSPNGTPISIERQGLLDFNTSIDLNEGTPVQTPGSTLNTASPASKRRKTLEGVPAVDGDSSIHSPVALTPAFTPQYKIRSSIPSALSLSTPAPQPAEVASAMPMPAQPITPQATSLSTPTRTLCFSPRANVSPSSSPNRGGIKRKKEEMESVLTAPTCRTAVEIRRERNKRR